MSEKRKVCITQTGSSNRHTQRQKDTLRALGLGRIGRKVVHELDPSIVGMIRKVQHMVVVQEHSESN